MVGISVSWQEFGCQTVHIFGQNSANVHLRFVHSTPETNILYVNYNWKIKIKILKRVHFNVCEFYSKRKKTLNIELWLMACILNYLGEAFWCL